MGGKALHRSAETDEILRRRCGGNRKTQLPAGANSTHTGCGTVTTLPVGVSRPVPASTLKETRLLLFMFAHTSHRPSGESSKLRGCWPPHGVISTSCSVPSALTENTAMLSWPRLDA